MAFNGSTLIEEIYKDLDERRKIVGHLSRVEFDDDEYKVLLCWSKKIVRHYDHWSAVNQRHARFLFLAFACEYVRRNKPTDDNVFWDDFLRTLELERNSYHLISDDLLWRGYPEVGIKRQQGPKNRKIVESLLIEVKASDADRKGCIDFFYWYYLHYQDREVTSSLLREYEIHKGESLHIHEKAITLLNQDFQMLRGIIEYINEHGITVSRTNPNLYREMIITNQGEDYDLAHIHFIRNGRGLRELFSRLENSVTPAKFLQQLKQYPQAMVYPPRGRYLTTQQAYQHWKEREFSYGLYKIDQELYQELYRVVPVPWLSLEAIVTWPYNQIITSLRQGYLGYKKNAPFTIRIGTRSVKGRQCVLEQNKTCYVWIGAVPKGEPLVIDGHHCPESEGISCDISLRIDLKDEEIGMVLILDTLKAFFPTSPRGHISICTSQGCKWDGYLTLECTLKYNHAIVFPLYTFIEPITITIYLDDLLISERVVKPEAAYLFSSQTYERIPAGSKQEWIGQQYYLLSSLKEKPIYDENSMTIEQFEGTFGKYDIYQVTWTHPENPFSIRTGNISWSFKHQHYFVIQSQPCSLEYIHLTHHQIQSFSHSHLQIMTDIPLEHLSATCQITVGNELILQNILDCLEPSSESHLYSFTSTFLEHIDQIVQSRPEEKRYDHYDIVVRTNNNLLDQISLTLIPKIQVHFSAQQLVREGTALELAISSPHLPLWDSKHNSMSSEITLQLYPSTHVRTWSKGIPYFDSQTIKAPLVFPSLGETVEIEITPAIFGFRIYQHQLAKGSNTNIRYQQAEAIDYYTLEKALCHIFTQKHASVEIIIEGRVIWKDIADDNGDLLIKDMQILRTLIQQEQTRVEIRCNGVTTFAPLYWRPIVHSLSLYNDQIHADIEGASDSSIILSLVDIHKNVLISHTVKCQGKRLETVLDIPPSSVNETLCYLIPTYILSDGTCLNSAQQWRVDISRQGEAPLPMEWLYLGIGIADEELLSTITKHIPLNKEDILR